MSAAILPIVAAVEAVLIVLLVAVNWRLWRRTACVVRRCEELERMQITWSRCGGCGGLVACMPSSSIGPCEGPRCGHCEACGRNVTESEISPVWPPDEVRGLQATAIRWATTALTRWTTPSG